MNRVFFDTNVLVYTDDPSVPNKQKRADALFTEHLAKGTAVLSLQVLQEYYWTATRKIRVSPEEAQRRLQILASTMVVQFETHDVIAAVELHRLLQVSFWDALILHAARIGGAKVLYSEDFQHGTVLAGVRIVNPFLA